jgi:ribosome-binding factor A
MKRTRRTLQVGEMMRDELARIIRHELSDPDLELASVTNVEVAPDLHFARVWVSAIGSVTRQEAALEAVKRADRKIRHELGRTKAFRYIPEIDWKLDTSVEYANRIEEKLREVLPEGPDMIAPETSSDDDER